MLLGWSYPQDEVENANVYTSNELSQSPDFVLEIAAPSPARPDCTIQREIYAPSGVAEYWRFDYTGDDYYGVALAGDRLASPGIYEPIPSDETPDGVDLGYSTALGLELHWCAGRLRFGNPATRTDLADLAELRMHREAITAATAAIRAAIDTMRAAQDAVAAVPPDLPAEHPARSAAQDTIAAFSQAATDRYTAEMRRIYLEAQLALPE